VSRPPPAAPATVRALGYTAAAWCLGFAAVSGWQVLAGPAAGQRLADYASGLAIMSVLVGVLKLAGAAAARAAPGRGPRRPRPVGPAAHLTREAVVPYVDVNGLATWHEARGEGEPVVLLHGAFGGASSWVAQAPAPTLLPVENPEAVDALLLWFLGAHRR
jgi:hypothetical protein